MHTRPPGRSGLRGRGAELLQHKTRADAGRTLHPPRQRRSERSPHLNNTGPSARTVHRRLQAPGRGRPRPGTRGDMEDGAALRPPPRAQDTSSVFRQEVWGSGWTFP